jgi:hypothetical protein
VQEQVQARVRDRLPVTVIDNFLNIFFPRIFLPIPIPITIFFFFFFFFFPRLLRHRGDDRPGRGERLRAGGEARRDAPGHLAAARRAVPAGFRDNSPDVPRVVPSAREAAVLAGGVSGRGSGR